jgi:histone deacetylase 1/2
MIAGLAAKEDRKMCTIDFPGAYLNADMKKTVIIKLDKNCSDILCKINPKYCEYQQANGTLLLKLCKALYGCVESSKLWYNHLKKELIKLRFVMNKYDECVFNRTEQDGSQTTLLIHVDDMLVTAKNDENIDHLIKELNKVFNEVSVERGNVLNYLGMVLDFRDSGKVKVSMPKFMNELLEDYKDVEGTAKTPAKKNLFDINEESLLLDAEDKAYFHTATAKLLYLCKRTRPDIMTAVVWLCTRVQTPREEDLEKLYRIIRYLRKTMELSLTIELSDNLLILIFIDASFGVHPDLKSHTGVGVLMGLGLIHGSSSKQKLNTKSSTEAEIVGASDGIGIGIWCRNFLIEQGYDIPPIELLQDNQSTIKLIKNGKSNSNNTRHINIKYYFIKDLIDKKIVNLKYMRTDDMVADIFTKPLQGKLFIKFRNIILNCNEN